MSEAKFRGLGFSRQDLELLGYREVEETEHENFNVLTGVASAGLEKIVGHFIYIKTRYTQGVGSKEQNVNDALKLALSKFWRNGQPHFSIHALHWAKGPLGQSIYCKAIQQAMFSCGILSKITISGVQEGGYAFSKDVLPDLQRYMDSGQLTGKLREVYRSLLQ
jgi:hypothetical protein